MTSQSEETYKLEITEPNYPKAGEIAPDFSFTTESGESMKLSDYRGSKCVILYFYPKDFTPGCTTEAREFTADYIRFEDRGIIVLGVSPDDSKSHTDFKQKMKIPYELISDPANKIASLYRCYGLKNYMGKEYMGIHRSTFLIGKDGRIVKAFYRVKPLGHSEKVLEVFGDCS